jgi:hypothetical protein
VDIRIDRLRLQVSGTHPDAARELGRLLAEHLAAALAGDPPAPDAVRLAGLRVSVPWPGGQHQGGSPPAHAAPAAAQVARALRGAAVGNAGATR